MAMQTVPPEGEPRLSGWARAAHAMLALMHVGVLLLTRDDALVLILGPLALIFALAAPLLPVASILTVLFSVYRLIGIPGSIPKPRTVAEWLEPGAWLLLVSFTWWWVWR
jgi:hypothetical protein